MKILILILSIALFTVSFMFGKVNQENKELKRQIENMHSIQRWQESIMRDCGFYGKED